MILNKKKTLSHNHIYINKYNFFWHLKNLVLKIWIENDIYF